MAGYHWLNWRRVHAVEDADDIAYCVRRKLMPTARAKVWAVVNNMIGLRRHRPEVALVTGLGATRLRASALCLAVCRRWLRRRSRGLWRTAKAVLQGKVCLNQFVLTQPSKFITIHPNRESSSQPKRKGVGNYPYLAIKKVKGHQYGYLQESYREGGQVRTRTVEYLGALDPATASRLRSIKSELRTLDAKQLTAPVRSVVANLATQSSPVPEPGPPKLIQSAATPEASPEQTVITKVSGTQNIQSSASANRLHFPADLSDFKVNHTAIERTHTRFVSALQKAGGSPTTMPEVTIRYGHPNRLERRRDGSYVVYASRRTQNKQHQLNKTALWRNYRRALASAYLDSLAADQPEKHHQLQARLDSSHRDTTRLLVQSLATASSPVERLGLSLQLRFWNRLPQRLQKKSAAESFGQVSFGTVNDWRREAVIVLAEAQRPGGWAGFAERQAKAQRQLKSAITRRRNKIDNMGFGQRLSARLSDKRRRILREIMAKEA